MRNPFRRRNSQTIAELESYYATQSTSRRGAPAWIMAIVSLLVTLLVIAALFFGARWVYRTVVDSSTNEPVATGTANGGEINGTVVSGDGSDDSGVVETLSSGETAGESSDDENESEGVVTDEAASTTRDESESLDTDSGTIATTGGGEIPNTGAGDFLFMIPLLTIAIGYSISRKYQLQK